MLPFTSTIVLVNGKCKHSLDTLHYYIHTEIYASVFVEICGIVIKTVCNSVDTLWRIRRMLSHDDFIKCKHFPRNWPFVWGIHRSTVNSSHKCQWRGALIFSLICVWINDWVKNREACDLRHYRAHYDVIVMQIAEDNILLW